jgi:hypothetical protein
MSTFLVWWALATTALMFVVGVMAMARGARHDKSMKAVSLDERWIYTRRDPERRKRLGLRVGPFHRTRMQNVLTRRDDPRHGRTFDVISSNGGGEDSQEVHFSGASLRAAIATGQLVVRDASMRPPVARTLPHLPHLVFPGPFGDRFVVESDCEIGARSLLTPSVQTQLLSNDKIRAFEIIGSDLYLIEDRARLGSEAVQVLERLDKLIALVDSTPLSHR